MAKCGRQNENRCGSAASVSFLSMEESEATITGGMIDELIDPDTQPDDAIMIPVDMSVPALVPEVPLTSPLP
eukprot:3077336-Amphidinium_carterae.2